MIYFYAGLQIHIHKYSHQMVREKDHKWRCAVNPSTPVGLCCAPVSAVARLVHRSPSALGYQCGREILSTIAPFAVFGAYGWPFETSDCCGRQKKIGTTVAFDLAIIRAVNDRQPGSIGFVNNLRAVDTVPPGKMPIAPPLAKKSKACLRVLRFCRIATFVSSNDTG